LGPALDLVQVVVGDSGEGAAVTEVVGLGFAVLKVVYEAKKNKTANMVFDPSPEFYVSVLTNCFNRVALQEQRYLIYTIYILYLKL
jgi:hypothetical protein